MFERNSLFVDVIINFPFRTRRYLSKGPSPLYSSTRLLRPLLNLKLLEVTSKQQNFLLHTKNISVHLNAPLKGPGSLLSCFLCLSQHIRGKSFRDTPVVKLSPQSYDCNWSDSVFICGRIQSSIFFLARAWYTKSVSISNSSKMFTSQNVKKVVVDLKHSQFCVFKNEKPNSDCLFVFNLYFDEFNFLKRNDHNNHLFRQFTIKSCIWSLVDEILCYSVSIAFPYLIGIGAFGQVLHRLGECTGFWILVTFSSCIHCSTYGLSKKTFSPSVMGQKFAPVGLCRQMLARFGKVQPSSIMSPSLS